VINKYLNSPGYNKSPFIEFIEGYISEFPEEKGVVIRIFEESTGYYYSPSFGPEIWIVNKNHKHGLCLLNQFGRFKSDYYSFNLNTATTEDLMSIKELKRNEIDSIINYRNNNGYFTTIRELEYVPGLDDEGRLEIMKSALNTNPVTPDEEYRLSYLGLSLSVFARLIEKGLFYLFLFITFYYLLFYGKNTVLKFFTIKYVLRKVLKLFFLVFMGFVAVLFGDEPLQNFLLLSILFIAIEMLVTKREKNRRDAFYTSFVMIVMIMFSVW
jgi:hypothetical protein